MKSRISRPRSIVRVSRTTVSDPISCYRPRYTLFGTGVRQTDFDNTIAQCVVSDRNLACSSLFSSDKTLYDSEVRVSLLHSN